mmetsp:Transcript_65586/g.182359  ORF Transcript_65586/g.182359 Transcript_65586/m.182359 type:complete len:104 (+) Transcript_65586:1180-1491(+)
MATPREDKASAGSAASISLQSKAEGWQPRATELMRGLGRWQVADGVLCCCRARRDKSMNGASAAPAEAMPTSTSTVTAKAGKTAATAANLQHSLATTERLQRH